MNEKKSIKTGWVVFWLILFFPVGLILTWTKTAWSKQTKWIVTGAVGVLLLFGSIGSSSNTKSSPTTDSSQSSNSQPTVAVPTDTPAPTEDPAVVKANYKSGATSVTVSDIAKDPNYYKNLTVRFTGTILNFVQDSSGNTSGANVSDPNDSIIQVVFSPFVEVQSMNKGDSITVWGKGLGSATGTNAFGGTIREGVVQEVYLNDTTSGYADELDHNPTSR